MPSKQENMPLREDKVYRPPDRDENEVNIDELLGRFKTSIPKIDGFKGGSPLLIFFVILIIALFWIGSGVYTVAPDQQAVVRTFGKFDGIRERKISNDEISQIAGRAGRYIHDGFFGTTGNENPTT